MSDEPEKPEIEEIEPEAPDESAVAAVRHRGSNEYFRKMMDQNFLEYASYVVKDRAIPDVDDGLKPVQRRILWSLYKIDDGRAHTRGARGTRALPRDGRVARRAAQRERRVPRALCAAAVGRDL